MEETMANIEKPARDRQIELMVKVKERFAGYDARWLHRPEFKEALHRHDKDCGDSHRPLKRARA
jgi:hypothetical protein